MAREQRSGGPRRNTRSAFFAWGPQPQFEGCGAPLQHPLQPLSTAQQRAVAADARRRSSERELAGYCTWRTGPARRPPQAAPASLHPPPEQPSPPARSSAAAPARPARSSGPPGASPGPRRVAGPPRRPCAHPTRCSGGRGAGTAHPHRARATMSVATQHSPFAVGSKRLFESEENEDRLQRRDSGAATHKRYRRLGSPNDRCGSGGCQGAYLVSPATLAALRGLFPEMSDKVRGAGGWSDVVGAVCCRRGVAIGLLPMLFCVVCSTPARCNAQKTTTRPVTHRPCPLPALPSCRSLQTCWQSMGTTLTPLSST